MKKITLLLVLFICSKNFAQQNYSIANFTPELIKESNSIIIDKSTKISIEKYNSMKIVEYKVISILNKKGLSDLDAFLYYDKSTKIKTLKATVYDALGQKIKTFKEKDFKDVSAVGSVNLYSDNRVKYLDYMPSSYPVTIHVEKEVKTRNTAFIRDFRPFVNYYQSIKKLSFEIENSSGVELRSFENDFMEGVETVSNTTDHIMYKVFDSPSIPREIYSPSIKSFTPRVMFALQTFELEREKGEIDSWKEFGKWQYNNLLLGLDKIPKATVSEIISMTKDLETDREKAQVVYEYVQNNTRYISVQIGLGGWKPISAEEVDSKKYGDCKGLTNYTKSLLKVIGVESNYCVVHAGSEKEDITSDFPSMQGNHVILNIPQAEGSDIWLECTSQDIPFNFLGTFTDDRTVVAITPTGGKILRTPSYSENENHQYTKSKSSIVDKSLHANVEISTRGSQYNNRYDLAGYAPDKVKSHYMSYWDNLKELNIEKYHFNDDKKEIVFTETLELKSDNYVKIYGNDLILDINPFNKFQLKLPNYPMRRTPFVIERGFIDEDEFVFYLSGLKLDMNLENIALDSEYGSYKLNFEIIDEKLIVNRYLKLNSNQYNKEDYDQFVRFFSEISKYDNTKLSFKII